MSKGNELLRGLSQKQIDLLRDVLRRRDPAGLKSLEMAGAEAVSKALLERLREAVADELMYSGFGVDYEPLRRGLELEDLISKIVKYTD